MPIQQQQQPPNPKASACLTVGLALSASNSTNYVLRWALTSFTAKDTPRFKLIHVLAKVLAVPTPMGNYIPIDKVRSDIADAYIKDVEHQAHEMLLFYKNMCDENKVEAEVLVIKGNDVVEAISNVVAEYHIQMLVVGMTTRSTFTRKSSGNRTSSKICKSVPSFCTTYLVSKDGLSSVYSPGLESDKTSKVPKSNYGISNSEVLSDEMSSRSDLNDSSERNLFDIPSPPCSRFSSENLENKSSADRNWPLTLYDYLSGSASVYTGDEDRRITSCTSDESSRSSKLRRSYEVPTPDRSLQGLMLSEHKDDVTTELEKLRLELRHMKGAYKLVQDESVDASQQMIELAARRREEEAQLREIQSRLDRADDKAQEEKAHRYAAEEEANRVQDLVREESLRKNMLQVKASSDADKKLRLEKLLALHGNSYSTFTWGELENATSSFSDSLKIGTGANGTVYKGYLNHAVVAIKVLHSDDSTRTKHFKQELEVLGRIRHPHLLMLLGACPDRGCLVYEYMENGSLEDRLQCKDGTPPLPWFHRFRIAWEIASALVFLHSTKPDPIIHRDLKPENVLLDGNLVSKIGDVGLSTLLPFKDSSSSRTVYKDTALAGTLFYIDPEYQRTGQVSAKSDTYALGMVILQLLTARPPIGLADLVERALEDGHLTDVLDKSAGKWPAKQVHDLAQLGLSCLEMRGKNRPDLRSRVVVELDRLNHIATAVYDPVQLAPAGPPSHFICPILKRVMQDPCIAADGYSYERNAIEMWLCENDVSPLTKSPLPNKTLVPNHSLVCAITSWRSQGT